MRVLKTEFKARISDNFTEHMKEYWSEENDIDYSLDPTHDFDKLANRITGKDVIIVETVYGLPEDKIENDYFEKVDDNWPLPRQSFIKT